MKFSTGFPGVLKRIFQAGSLIRSKMSKAAESKKSGVLAHAAKPLKIASLKIDPIVEKWAKDKGGSSSKSSAIKNVVKSVKNPVTTLAKKKTSTKPQLSAAKKTAKKAKSSAVALGSAAINI